MADIFLSYNRDDQAIAKRFAEAFEAEGFFVWWDVTLHSGDAYDQVTEEALKKAKAVVVLWSKQSVNSRWVRAEATLANRNNSLVPVRIEPCDLPIMFELTHTADLSNWNGKTSDPAWQGFLADVKRFVNKDGHSEDQEQPAFSATRQQPQSTRAKLFTLLSLVIAIAVGVTLYLGKTTRPGDNLTSGQATIKQSGESSEQEVQTGVSEKEAPAIAVLPFENMTGDPDQEYFSDGVAEEILNSLSRISKLQVRGRTSSFYFKDRNEDLKTIAEQLNVNHILEGSVRKDGEKRRITVQLISVPTDTHLWSKTYDRVLEDIFAIQEDIAASVAAALEVSLGVGELGSEPGMTRNVRAYELFLEGRKQSYYSDRDKMLRAIELMEKAVAIDPQFANAWAFLANAYSVTGRFFIHDQVALYQQRSTEALSKAEQLAPDLWSVQLNHSQILQTQYRWQEAEAIIQHQLIKRNNSMVDFSAGLFEANVGHSKTALILFEKAARAEPLNQNPVFFTAVVLASSGDYVAAQEAYKRARDLPVGNTAQIYIGELFLTMAQKDRVAVKRALDLVLENSDLTVGGREGLAFFFAVAPLLDSPQSALELVRSSAVDPRYRKIRFSGMGMAAWAAYFGDPQLALDLYYREGKPEVLSLVSLWQPDNKDMRRLPGFKQLVIDLGLVDYWRATGKWGDFCKPLGDDDFECF